MSGEQKGFRDKTRGVGRGRDTELKRSRVRRGLGFGFKGRTMTKGFNDTNGQQQSISHLTQTCFQKSSGTDFRMFSIYCSCWILYHHQVTSGLHHGNASHQSSTQHQLAPSEIASFSLNAVRHLQTGVSTFS